jgi:hypothetical protein
MRRFALALAFLTTGTLASGCQPACPAIAQAPFVSVTVAVDYVPAVKALHLKACQDGACHEADLELLPGTRSVDQVCEPSLHGNCSATPSPDGTVYGLLDLGILTESPIDSTLTGLGSDGAPLSVRTLTFRPKANFPYGERCVKFLSAALVLDAAGLRQE